MRFCISLELCCVLVAGQSRQRDLEDSVIVAVLVFRTVLLSQLDGGYCDNMSKTTVLYTSKYAHYAEQILRPEEIAQRQNSQSRGTKLGGRMQVYGILSWRRAADPHLMSVLGLQIEAPALPCQVDIRFASIQIPIPAPLCEHGRVFPGRL
jgi:hypothetical protein